MLPEDTFVYRDHPQQAIKAIQPKRYLTAMKLIYDRFLIAGELRQEVDTRARKSARMLGIVEWLKRY